MKKLKWWFKYKGKYIFKDFIQGVKNLVKYFKIIWNDRDYDYGYIYNLLQFKLIKQAKYIGSNNRHTSAKRDAWVMNIIVKLIEKEKEEWYETEYMNYHDSKFEFLDIPNQSEYKELHIELISENFDEYFKKYPLIYKKVISMGNKNFYKTPQNGTLDKKKIAMNISYLNQQRAKKLLFKLLEENIGRFWD